MLGGVGWGGVGFLSCAVSAALERGHRWAPLRSGYLWGPTMEKQSASGGPKKRRFGSALCKTKKKKKL